MNLVSFVEAHEADWLRLEQPAQLDRASEARLYRQACEHLAIARSRDYPMPLIERLEAITAASHQRIYRESGTGLGAVARLARVDFPQTVRSHRRAMWLSLAAFAGPLIAAGLAAYFEPTFILTLLSAGEVREFDAMYGSAETPIGRSEDGPEWLMFGFYLRHNTGLALQCFATGALFGLGSLFFLAYNGLVIGAVAGYLTWRGHGENFWPFVATHGAFELTAIVIAGAAGLSLGGALLAPGRRPRLLALREATVRAAPLVYGFMAMFVLAAAVEAFWSSARWVPAEVKFAVAGLCWSGVLGYLLLQARQGARSPGGDTRR